MSNEEIARRLIWPLWRGLDPDYKARYARDIWEQFTHAIRAASYTDSLARMLDRLMRRLPIQIVTEDLRDVNEVLQSGSDRDVLRRLRYETATIVLYVRLLNEKRKES